MANLVFQTNNQAYVSYQNHPPECLLLSWNRDSPCDKRSYTADVLQSNDEVMSCVTFVYMFQNQVPLRENFTKMFTRNNLTWLLSSLYFPCPNYIKTEVAHDNDWMQSLQSTKKSQY